MNCGFLLSLKGPALGALLLTVTACGGGSDTSSGNTGTPSATLAEQIKALEDSGQLPKLDRSSDIRGPDADNNGIRDDIDAWIATLSITDAQKKAARQASRVMQLELLADTNDRPKLDQLGNASMAAVKCLGDSFKPSYCIFQSFLSSQSSTT